MDLLLSICWHFTLFVKRVKPLLITVLSLLSEKTNIHKTAYIQR